MTFPSVPTAKKVGVLQLLKGSEESLCASVGGGGGGEEEELSDITT